MTEVGYEIVIDINVKTCACKNGLPRYHACAYIHWKNLNIVDYIEKTFIQDMYLTCYEHTLQPINSQQCWQKTGIAASELPLLQEEYERPKKQEE